VTLPRWIVGSRLTITARTNVVLIFAIVLCGFCFPSVATGEPKSPPPHLHPDNPTRWADRDLGIRFSYPRVWHPGTPSQDSTRVVVNWRLTKSKTLLASCYIEAHDRTPLKKIHATEIHRYGKAIAESYLRNMRQRIPDAVLVSWMNAVQDGHPVVYLIREGTTETFDRKSRLKSFSMVTVWREREINFECGTPIFGREYEQAEKGPWLIERVEEGIKRVMRSLQFDRVEHQ
jgi:hypothetical protein